MRCTVVKSLIPPLAFALVATLPATTHAQQDRHPEIQEWMVPYEDSRPRDPMVAPDGRVWFVGQAGAYVAVFDPETEEFRKYDTDGVRPHNLIVDPEGIVWYAGNTASHIGRLDPETGEITKYMMPDERARDPHTLVFDSQGDIWFTVQGGNFIGKFWPETGEVRLVEALQVEGRRRGGSSRPYGIVVDSDDRPWVALFNTNHIATVDPETFELETIELPWDNALPRRIAITSDDVLWYGDWTRGTLGRVDPDTREVTEFPLPAGEDARPYAMLADQADRIWVVETGPEPNRFVGFDPRTEEMFSVTAVPSGGGTVRHMYLDAENDAVWFGADTNTIGVAKLPPIRVTSH